MSWYIYLNVYRELSHNYIRVHIHTAISIYSVADLFFFSAQTYLQPQSRITKIKEQYIPRHKAHMNKQQPLYTGVYIEDTSSLALA